MEKHNCGGNLRRRRMVVTKNIGGLDYQFNVVGKQCTRCSERVISRDTLRRLEAYPMRLEQTYRRKGQVVITLDIPMIQLAPVGTADGATPISVVDTGQVAYAR